MHKATSKEIELFNNSYERCLRKPGFLSRFYEIFLASSEEVAEKFKETDFHRQTMVLKASLYFLMLTSSGTPESLTHLERMAQLHDREHLDIRPELYDLWLSCLLQAVEEFDPAYNRETNAAWQSVLEIGISYMKSRY